jgi:hypothetical protein
MRSLALCGPHDVNHAAKLADLSCNLLELRKLLAVFRDSRIFSAGRQPQELACAFARAHVCSLHGLLRSLRKSLNAVGVNLGSPLGVLLVQVSDSLGGLQGVLKA